MNPRQKSESEPLKVEDAYLQHKFVLQSIFLSVPFFFSSPTLGVLEDVGGDVHVDTPVLRDEVPCSMRPYQPLKIPGSNV